MKPLNHLSLALVFTSALSACQSQAENTTPPADRPELPAMPFTEQSLKAFADPADYQRFFSLSPAKGREASADHLSNHTIIDDSQPVPFQEALIHYTVPGGHVIEASYAPTTPELKPLRHLRYSWNTQGKLTTLDFSELTKADWQALAGFDALRGISSLGFRSKEDNIDLHWLQPLQNLEYLKIHSRRLFHFNELCHLPKLAVFTGPSTYPQEPIRFNNCQAPLVKLDLQGSRLDDLAVSHLPNLIHLKLNRAKIHKLAIDGDTLPSLQYLELYETQLPSDLSHVNLPDSLVQLDMYQIRDPDVSQIRLPEHLKYLNLQGAQLEDYSFITTAKHLESLRLTGSNFHQFELLAQLPTLKHLAITSEQFSDQHLPLLAKMTDLQFLGLAGTSITTLEPLSHLKTLRFLILTNAKITDYKHIPYFSTVIGIELPNTEQRRRNMQVDDLPEAVQKMALASRIPVEQPPELVEYYAKNPRAAYDLNYGKDCQNQPNCTVAPWLLPQDK